VTDDAELQPAVAAQFEALAELLSAAPDAVWDTGSLCDGWRVREVVAHMTMPARYSDDQFMAELERCGYDFTRLSNEIASRDAAVPSAQLVSDLRSDVLGHWSPPGGGFHGALIHVVIHGLDVTVPLREARLTPDEILRVVLDDLTKGGAHQHFDIDISGRILEANDIYWTYGSGQALRGAAEDLALAMCGRRLPSGRLEGTPLLRRQPGDLAGRG
jgi:uncharacterized protein (TIGR03083 family)